MRTVVSVVAIVLIAIAVGLLGSFVYEWWKNTKSRRARAVIMGSCLVIAAIGGYWQTNSSSSAEGAASGPDGGEASTSGVMLAELAPGDFVCNDVPEVLFVLTGAIPGERVAFDHSQEPPVSPAQADGNGRVDVTYSCPPSLPRRVWTVLATSASGKVATVQITASPPGAPASVPTQRSVTLAQGSAASSGYFYSVNVSGFEPISTVTIGCFDSEDAEAFFTYEIETDGSGSARADRRCFSGDGPDHWVVADGTESNHVEWGPSVVTPSGAVEIAGGATATWTDYTSAGGSPGPIVPPLARVAVQCRVLGFSVANGNPWWYRLVSSPWDGAFYASADAFYNNGATSGPLTGTPFVDETVPSC